MQFLKKVFRNIFRVILGLILFVLLYLSLSWLLPFVKLSRTVQHPDQGIELFIQSNGVHTDFAMPVRTKLMDWNRFLPCSDFEVADPSFKYIAMGWGDKGFFIGTPTWDDLKFSTVFNAAFGLSSAAMHVTYKKNKPKENNSCKKIIISGEQYKKLIIYILSSFRHHNKKPMLIDHPGYTSYDRFYEAEGTYTMFNTCNVWTGNGLRSIGVEIGAWTPFQGGIMDHVK